MVKPEAPSAVVRSWWWAAHETCSATQKRQVINLWNCCISLVDLFVSYDDSRTCESQINKQLSTWEVLCIVLLLNDLQTFGSWNQTECLDSELDGIPRIIIMLRQGVCGTKWPIQVARHSFHLLPERDNMFSSDIYAAATWCLSSPRI